MSNPFTNLIPAAYRRYVYAALSLAGLVVTVAQILGYDMTKAAAIVAAIGATLGFGLAHGNTAKRGGSVGGSE